MAGKNYNTKEAENEHKLDHKVKYSETIRFQGTIGIMKINILYNSECISIAQDIMT